MSNKGGPLYDGKLRTIWKGSHLISDLIRIKQDDSTVIIIIIIIIITFRSIKKVLLYIASQSEFDTPTYIILSLKFKNFSKKIIVLF